MSPNNAVAYINARVYTVNQAAPWAEAFIVTPDGKFGVIGTTSDVLAMSKAAGTVVRDMDNAFIMPGIHDAHVHTLHSGAEMLNWAKIEPDTSKANAAKRLQHSTCVCQFSHAYQDWIVGAVMALEDYDRSYFDGDYPETPVLLYSHALQCRYANTAALQRAGYDIQNEPEPQFGTLPRRPDGSLTGELIGQVANRASAAVPTPPITHIKRMLQRAITELHRNGVTSCQEASANEVMLQALSGLGGDGQLRMQFATHILYKNAWLSGEIISPPDRLILDSERYRTKHTDTRFVKFMMDGAPVPPLFTHSGVDKDGKPDESKILLPDIDDILEKFDARGLTCKIHAMGEGGAMAALNAFEKVRRKNPNGPPHEIAHCTNILPEDFTRFNRLNITAEMSPAGFFDTDKLGREFALFNWNFERMVDAGNHVTIGSDWAYGLPLPMLPSVAVVARKVGIEKTLEMITLAGAKATNREKEAGSIETGKVASFIQVNRDLTKGDFENAKVLRTWFEGELVYDGTISSSA
ncbi:amidohydrolase 3 [Ilyonectria destructans]|nr:amidohydrolase 3 [Ilyonectria destructans]